MARSASAGEIELLDLHPEVGDLREEVLEGLRGDPKRLPCKLFYDERGSELYERITRLDEYYQTRTEAAIMRTNIEEIVSRIESGCLLIEYGSGNSEKTRILLDHLEDIAAYVPIDISRDHLMQAAVELEEEYPDLEIRPVCADYTSQIELPEVEKAVSKRVVFFPGSTIGNFEPHEAVAFLRRIAEPCEVGDGLLLGADLKKDRATLEAAYNDSAGVTAEFNLNMLRHINRKLGTDFDLEAFEHRAIYNEDEGRIEMWLVSLEDQTVQLNGDAIALDRGDMVWTESSYKYTPGELADLARQGGFALERTWTDPRDLFSVNYLRLNSKLG